MRRVALILLGFAAFAALIAASASGEGDDSSGDYKVRAYFDNAGFLVNGEEVRVAGATIGVVDDVTVSLPGESVKENGDEDPGKAVAVLAITDPGFQDFRTDASCLIRPQSLLGEKYVECVPTQPRAPGTEPPPELAQIADGDIGAGEYALPLENNGKQVDLDLVNNITRQPETDRFRLILNDLGAGLAARGPDLEEVIRRADPALAETDKVLATLAKQNKQLAQLAKDSDTVLTPLARERQHLAGFIRNSATAGAAAAERSNDIVAGFDEFPNALRELNSTMVELQRFAEQATPVATDLRKAAPGLTGATKALAPFARAATISVTSLGNTTAASSDDLAGSAPVIRQLRKVGEKAIPGAKNLNQLFMTLRKTGGIDSLAEFVLNGSNALNTFDSFGHLVLANVQITNCVNYSITPTTGCSSNWFTDTSSSAAQARSDASAARDEKVLNAKDPAAAALDATQEPAASDSTDGSSADSTSTTADSSANDDLLNFLIGDGQ